MPLILKPVEAARGLRWVRDGFSLFGRQPLAFSTLFALFLFATVLSALVPLLGLVVQMGGLPLVSLGFMVAAQAALMGQRVTPLHFIEPLRGDPARRRSLLVLCAAYATGGILLLLGADLMSNQALDRMREAAASGQDAQVIANILNEPQVGTAALVFGGGWLVLSVLFWHAPALVHWGGQGVGQALFSSTVAVWRSKGAFALYGVAWAALMLGLSFVLVLVMQLFGLLALAPVLATPLGLFLSTVFYVSLLFTFNDSFGGSAPAAPEAQEPPPAEPPAA